MNSAAKLWQKYQDWLYYNPDLEFYVDISRMGFTQDFVTAIEPKFAKAFADMKALEAGAIANPDEQRMVGHYWLRYPEIAPTTELRDAINSTIDQIEAFTQAIHTGKIHPPTALKFTDILSIGIGGSALGPQFVAQALAIARPLLNISFIDNTDPDGIDLVLSQLGDRLATTLVITISKSGGTPEPNNAMHEVKAVYAKVGLDFPKYAIAVTGIGSNLDKLAKAEGWLEVFPMYDWVGGRTSELSAVGLLPAALQGVDIRGLLTGAKMMDSATRVEYLKQNPAAMMAMAWYFSGDGKGLKDMVVLPYKDRLMLFSRYLQQLVMESLGKEKDLDGNTVYQGIAVYGNKGSTDQHAYVQQLREGIPNFFATFIEVLNDTSSPNPPLELESGITSGDYLSGLLQGTRQALYENGRDSITVTIPTVSAVTIGALIALYERAVSFYASLVNINAYHQPGVEAGKKAAAQVLELQKQVVAAIAHSKAQNKPAISITEIATQINAVDQIEVIYRILRHLHANQRIQLKGNFSMPSSLEASIN
jgi:glucose-6-phosphate isomerase